MKEKAVTLMEMIVVVIIISITATFGIMHFSAFKEQSFDREVNAFLKQIRAAERIYHLKHGTYYPPPLPPPPDPPPINIETCIVNINTNLKLYLPTTPSRNWNYSTTDTGCAQAVRNGADARTWRIRITNEDEPLLGVCP